MKAAPNRTVGIWECENRTASHRTIPKKYEPHQTAPDDFENGKKKLTAVRCCNVKSLDFLAIPSVKFILIQVRAKYGSVANQSSTRYLIWHLEFGSNAPTGTWIVCRYSLTNSVCYGNLFYWALCFSTDIGLLEHFVPLHVTFRPSSSIFHFSMLRSWLLIATEISGYVA